MNAASTTDVLAYVTVFAPLLSAVLITLFTLRSKAASMALSLGGMFVALGCNIALAVETFGSHEAFRSVHEFSWIVAGPLDIRFGVLTDSLSVLMGLVVTGVGSCIFVYSTAYMKGEEGYSRYFACLSLFAFSMLGIVFSTNFVETFIFWELVGVSSYALIGYYFAKPSAVEAGKKAFLTNRIGDFGMTVGILLLFWTLFQNGIVNNFSFVELADVFHFNTAALAPHTATLQIAALLIFTGAMAKSAQFPLHVWLPDAMEGPTPVSALMHAATMVAAGVYLVARTYFLFWSYDDALHVLAYIGGITALMAALMAFVQHDIKKVLAYSTLSQLGYMVLSLGLLGPAAAMFHLTTHAFFKALLFLGAGSVIHGCHHEQDMRHMGGLAKHMPVTRWTFLIGTLALAGIFPLSGFWSKDAILSAALHHNVPLLVLAVAVAFMTACYMGRAYWMTFHGEYRGHAHPHESPAPMTVPLVVLSVGAFFGGLLSIPKDFFGKTTAGWLEHALMSPPADAVPGAARGPAWFPDPPEELFDLRVALIGTIAALLGGFVAWKFYRSRAWSAERFVQAVGPFHRVVVNKFYIDDFYMFLVRKVQQRVADACAWFEKSVLVQTVVDGIAGFHRWMGYQIRLLLDGHLHRYVTLALVGVVVVLAYLGMRQD